MFEKILIGSSALKNVCPDLKRIPKDIDYAISKGSYYSEKRQGMLVEYHPIPALFKFRQERLIDILYTLKLSHSVRDISFDKTMHDIHFMKERGAKIIDPLLQELLQYWDVIHGKRISPDFMQKNDDFFDDIVDRRLQHDDLHNLMKKGDKPMYSYVKKNLDLAIINMDMFYNLPFEKQLLLIQEEAGVICLERFLLTGKTKSVDSAMSKSLRIMVTRLFGVKTAIFTAENYGKIRQDTWTKERIYEIYKNYSN